MAIEVKSTRDALEKIRDYILTGKSGDGCMAPILNWCDAALSEPVKNCDVGTAREQYVRFTNYCNAHGDCVDCPIKAEWHKALSCGILWAQMPYEEGCAK